MNESTRFYRVFVWHLIADWLFQNHWMANQKSDLNNLAAWTHGSIHFLAMLRVFTWPFALILALIHMLVDTRKPLQWWRGIYRQTTVEMNDHAGWHTAIWGDQVLHIVCIAAAAWFASRDN